MFARPFLAALALSCSSLWSCARDDGQSLVITGSSTVAPLASEIALRFEAEHPGVRIDVQMGGSSRGIADAREGSADIGMISRSPKDSESDLQASALARDGICLITHRENPVRALDDAQVVAIYTGQITRWNEVGGPDAPITVVHKAEGRSTLELFLKHFGLQNSQVRPQVVIGDNEQGIKTVAGNPNALGYVSIGAAEYDATHEVPIRLLPIGGVAASIDNVRNGSFPLSRTLHFVTRDEPEGLAAEFLEYAASSKVHDLVRGQYFVPLDR